MATLEKYCTRDHTVFVSHLWDETNRHGLAMWVDPSITTLLLIKPTEDAKVQEWYDREEFARVLSGGRERILRDPTYYPIVRAAYIKYWARIFPVFAGTSVLKTSRATRSFYKTYRSWGSVMPVVYVIPSLPGIPEDIVADATRLRLEEAAHADNVGTILVDAFRRLAPGQADLAELVTPKEYFTFLGRTATAEEKAQILPRREGYVIANGELASPHDLKSILQRRGWTLAEEAVPKSITELRGIVASAGNARGRVRLVTNRSGRAAFQAGKILVTEMTGPDDLPMIKRAAAIVTDEGGITSHAVIVSRELGKPCVIGTRIATKVLRDGVPGYVLYVERPRGAEQSQARDLRAPPSQRKSSPAPTPARRTPDPPSVPN
jgi:phosphohistidine swiveling domain-containing protein